MRLHRGIPWLADQLGWWENGSVDEPLSLEEARERLDELVNRAAAGEHIEIREGDAWVTLIDAGLLETLDILADGESREDIRAALKENPRSAEPLEKIPDVKQPRSA